MSELRHAIISRVTNLPNHTVSVVSPRTIAVVHSFVPTSAYVWAAIGTLLFFLVAPLFLWLLVARRRVEMSHVALEETAQGTGVEVTGAATTQLLEAIEQVLQR